MQIAFLSAEKFYPENTQESTIKWLHGAKRVPSIRSNGNSQSTSRPDVPKLEEWMQINIDVFGNLLSVGSILF